MAELIVTLVPVRMPEKTRIPEGHKHAPLTKPEVAELIADMEAAGATTYAIQQELNRRAQGDPAFAPARGGKRWYWSSVNSVLKSDWFAQFRRETSTTRPAQTE